MLDEELEAWEDLEELYREVGVSRYANLTTDGKVCILTGLAAIVRKQSKEPALGMMLARLHSSLDGKGISDYNDTHTREENLALIAQCRAECAADLAKIESFEVTV